MTGKELIKGIKEDSNAVWRHLFSLPAQAVHKQIRPLMKDVKDVTFDDVFEEACIILMENVKAGKLDEKETNLEGYLYVVCKRIALRHANKKKSLSIRKVVFNFLEFIYYRTLNFYFKIFKQNVPRKRSFSHAYC